MTDKSKGKSPAESFGELLKEFGDAVGKIFDDPDLKKKAKDFGDSAVKSAKHFGGRFKDDEVKAKFKDVGIAAKDFGNSVSDYFKDDKEKQEEGDTKKKDDWEEKIDEKIGQFSKKVEKAGKEFGEKTEAAGKRVDRYFKKTRGGRITGYGFSIFFSSLFLIIIYYFNRYIAFYNFEGTGEAGTWERYSFLTPDFERWLPIAITALLASIIGNIILIIYDGYSFRQLIHLVMDMFSVASVITLLVIFPFDFSVFPGNDLTNLLNPIITAVLIFTAVAMGIAILVRFIKMIVGIAGK